MMNAIEVTHASKVYRRYSRRRQFATLKSALLGGSLLADLRPDETFAALQDVSFAVAPGRTLGVIGRNGSGKSTLLKLVAGITKPTVGDVRVRGRISALIELGAGFHPEISGRENVFINGIMLGLSKREVARRFQEIVDFAELQEFIDAPVKTYSSGMYMRLGFAVAIHVDPDVLLVDEVLAVGDEGFTKKCLDKFAEFKRRGKTILLVTHALGLVERFCDEALWLDGGRMKAMGDPKRVVDAYITDVEISEEQHLAAGDAKVQIDVRDSGPDAAQAAEHAPPRDFLPAGGAGAAGAGDPEPPRDFSRAVEGRWGSREIEITDVVFAGPDGQRAHVFQSGEQLDIHIKMRAQAPIVDFVIGVGIFNAEGVCCYGTNTSIEQLRGERIAGDAEAIFTIESLDLVEGTYKLDAAVHKTDGYPYDYHRLLHTFRVKSRTKDVGIYRPKHAWRFSEGLKLSRTDGDGG
jgi:ABC-type polysaccharide/polyol phosphate transport system ATPase subunit